jgi:TPR repeat protein
MRISERIISVRPTVLSVVLLAAGFGVGPASAFDGTRSPSDIAPAVGLDLAPQNDITAPALAPSSLPAKAVAPSRLPGVVPGPVLAPPGIGLRAPPPGGGQLNAIDAFRSGHQALAAGNVKAGIAALEYAATRGHVVAQWKLGRMYADGSQVKRDDYRAFRMFQDIADERADDSIGTAQAPFVANALVSLGLYYADGIANSPVKANPYRAREMFAYAASYFGDAQAQYHLGRMYHDGKGGEKDGRQAARWLTLAANKGQPQAQALLGAMLFKGDLVPRQAARGLMWLTLARDAAPQDKRITELHAAASAQASDDQRAMALTFIETWLNGSRP